MDVLQIPAFLCRQTDLLVEAGRSGRAVNIKKGQFLAPYDMRFAAEKVASTGNNQILLTERGTSFWYQNLVVDFRGLPIVAAGVDAVFMEVHEAPERALSNGSNALRLELLSGLLNKLVALDRLVRSW